MVGFDRNQDYYLSPFWYGMAGVLSGTITRFLCQPLDVFKIRFQLQHEPLKPSQQNYYWNLKQASSRIIREETYRAMWKGHVPAQLLSGVYGLAQFSVFEFLTQKVYLNSFNKPNDAAVHFVCGSVSGAVATFFSMPFDVVRTRLVGQGEPKVYNGVRHAFTCIRRGEGFKGLYKGFTPTVLQIMPLTGFQFAFFEIFSKLYHKIQNTDSSKKLPTTGSLVCGSAAGILAKILVYPLDLTKKRIQVQGFEIARTKFGKVKYYSSWKHCLRHTVKYEGVRGLFKGLSPSLLKAMITTGLTFTLYEEISSIFKSLRL